MTPQRWDRLQELFESLADLPRAEQQVQFARLKASETDPDLLNELARLLSASGDGSFFIDRPVIDLQSWEQQASSWGIGAGDVLAERFEIVRFIGAGGMGEVFEARDRSLSETVALKCLKRELSRDADMATRFRQEVQLSRRVTHRNVCRIFDLGQHEREAQPLSFLTMEFVPGGDLAQLIRKKDDVTLDTILSLLRQTAEGIAAAHEAGVIHRDLKPSNVLIDQLELNDARAVITDFGLARVLAPSDSQLLSSLTQTRAQVGTLAYMSPEQLQGEPATVRSDIYSLALLMYEAVTERRPFGEGGSLASLVKRSTQTPTSPQQFTATLPARWSGVILHCLDPDPTRRPSSVREVLAELDGQKRLPKRRSQAPSRRQWLWWAGGAAAGTAGAALWRWSEVSDSLGPMKVSQGTKLLLTQIAYPKEDPDLLGMTSLFASQLAQSAQIEIIHPNSVPELLQMTLQKVGEPVAPQKARQLALRMQVPLVLFGAVTRVGSEYVVNLTLERMSQSSELPQEARPKAFPAANLGDLMNTAHDAARWVRQTAGEMPATIQAFDRKPEEATTDSWEALKDFTQGEMELEARHRENALLAYESAIQSDPGFAMAWMRKGDVYIRMARSDEGHKAWQKAISLLPARPLTKKENWRIRAMYASDTWDYAESVELLKEYAYYYPHDLYALFYRGFPLMMLGRFSEAIELLKTCFDAGFRRLAAASQITIDYAAKGDLAAARRELAVLQGLNSPGAFHHVSARVEGVAGNYAESRAHFLEAGKHLDEVWQSDLRDNLGRLAVETGDEENALKIFSDGADADQKQGLLSNQGQKLLSAAAIQVRAGRAAEAKRLILKGVDCDPGPTRVQYFGTLLAQAGFVREAKELAQRIDPSVDLPLFRQARHRLRGEILLAQDDAKAALTEFQTAAKDCPEVLGRDWLARAYERLGEKRAALDGYMSTVNAKAVLWTVLDPGPAGIWREALESAVRLAKDLKDARLESLKAEWSKLRKPI